MGVKKVLPSFLMNWTSTTPIPFNVNTPLSGTTAGAMASTNTVYSNIQDITNIDNVGLELTWTGTPTGTIQVMVSSSGLVFYPLSFSPAIGQPTGSAGGYVISLNQVPWRYFFVEYTNSSGSGSLTTYVTQKDVN